MDQKAAKQSYAHSKRIKSTDDPKSRGDDGQRRNDRSASDGDGKEKDFGVGQAQTESETPSQAPVVETLEPEAPTIEVKKPRKPRGTYTKTQVKPSDEDLNAIRFVAMTATASLSALAVGVLRDARAAMTAEENALISQTAEQTLLTLSNEAREKINKYAAPGMLLTAVGTWAIRVATLPRVEKAKQSTPIPTTSVSPDGTDKPLDEGHNPELVETFGRRL